MENVRGWGLLGRALCSCWMEQEARRDMYMDQRMPASVEGVL